MGDKCNSCKNRFNGQNGSGYQPCGCKNVRSSHVNLRFKIFPDLSAFVEAAQNNQGEIKPFNEFKDFSISDRLQMIETLNQVVSADKGLMLDHTKEAAKKLQQLIESL
ncbi:hypothetical protein [Acinetobacter sp. ANC 4640]